jgi:hypothetical protein
MPLLPKNSLKQELSSLRMADSTIYSKELIKKAEDSWVGLK